MALDNKTPHIASTLEGRDFIVEELVNELQEKKRSLHAKSEVNSTQIPLEQKLQIHLKNQDYNRAIDTLNLIKDKNRGQLISKYADLIMEDEKNTQTIRVLHRNALQQTPFDENRKEHSFYEGWAIMGLNFMSAAEILIKHYPYSPEKSADEIKGMFIEFYNQFKYLVLAFIKWMQTTSDFTLIEKLGLFEHTLIRKLVTITGLAKDDVKNFLTLAREFSSYDHDYTAVVTQLSINIEPEYQAKWGHEVQVWRMMLPMVSHNNQSWVRSNDPKKKALIKAYESKMDSHPTPTQLRMAVVGPKNACDHRTFVVYDNKKGEQQVECINQFYTSGIPGHLLENAADNARATAESLMQIKSLTGAKTLHTHSLVNRTGEEKDLDNQVASAARRVGNVIHSNTPFQPLRYFTLNNLTGCNAILSLVENVKSETLQKIVTEYKRATSWKRFFNSSYYSHNHNLHLASLIQQMIFHIYKEKIKDVGTTEERQAIAKELVDIVFCKSGKDRTGEAREAMDMYALLLTITGEIYGSDITVGAQAFQKQALEILTKFKKSFHVGMHTGMAVGGTMGAFGILGDISSGKPDGWPSQVELTAKYNKGFVKDPKKAILKGWLVGLWVVIGCLLTFSGLGAVLGASMLASAATATTSFLVSGTLLGSVAICTSVIGGLLLGKSFFKTYYYGNHKPPYLDKPDVPFYKNPHFWAVTLLVTVSVGLCFTGFGAILGGPLALLSLGAVAAASGIISHAAIVGLTLGIMTLITGGLLQLKRQHQQKRYDTAVKEFKNLVDLEVVPKAESFSRMNLKIDTKLSTGKDFFLESPTPKTSYSTKQKSSSVSVTPNKASVSITPPVTPTSATGPSIFRPTISVPNLQRVVESESSISRTPSPVSPKGTE